jgi:[protein-PII] uridylyltransferase
LDALKHDIEDLLYHNAPAFEISKVLKKHSKAYFNTLEESFRRSGGKDFLVKHTKQIDKFLKYAYLAATRDMFGEYLPLKNNIPITLVAMGSYGREQLCIHSDIDLMLTYDETTAYNTLELIEKILYILWDAGLKLGHRVHKVTELMEVSQSDITIKTALVESRFIEGSKHLWTKVQNSITQIRLNEVESYIEQKLLENQKLHNKYPLTMEPNLKEGVGGFRDANLVHWIGTILYNTHSIKTLPETIVDEKSYKTFRIALEFLFRVRSALHLTANKKEDTLRLVYIPQVTTLLGFKEHQQLKFTQKVISSLKTISLYTTIWVERLTNPTSHFFKHSDYLPMPKSKANYLSLLNYLITHAQHPFKPHPTLLYTLHTTQSDFKATDPLYYQTLFQMFHVPHTHSILLTLSQAQVLRHTITGIKKVVDLPQFDGYHTYSVDVHSIKSVYYIEHIEEPFLETLHQQLSPHEKALLKLIIFLHDAGKGRKRDHHEVGVSIFKGFAKKLNLSEADIQTASTLIRYHTLMSKVAQREDIHDEKSVLKFASHFKRKKMLDLIYLLTYADMSAVGPNVYNSFNAKLLKTLYLNSLEVLSKDAIVDETAKRVEKEATLKRSKHFKALTKKEQKKVLHIPSNLPFIRYTPERIVTISKAAFITKGYNFVINNENHLSIEIIRETPLQLGFLLTKLSQLEVANMDICKLFDHLKYFKIEFYEKVEREDIPHIEHTIHQAFIETETQLKHPIHLKKEEITIECHHSSSYAKVDIKTKNQKGLLAHITTLFDTLKIDIASAKMHTIKNRAIDTLLIEKNGNFCHNTDYIVEKLMESI